MSNLEIWNKHADIDPKFTKPITGKQYKGTSPQPHHIIWCLTDMFGPVGKGFGWSVVAESFEQFGETTLHWCRIVFWWRDGDTKNEFESYGQTKAAYKTNSGKMIVDEDAPKKSLTDAITKAASQLGVAANIFLGRWDDSKYIAGLREEFSDTPKFNPDAAADRVIAKINAANTIEELKEAWGSEKTTIAEIRAASADLFKKIEEAKDKTKTALSNDAPF